jgi:hypothetical protein
VAPTATAATLADCVARHPHREDVLMKRWALCRMGAYDPTDPNTRGPALDRHANVSYRIWEHPTKNWCLAHFATNSLTTINADSDIKVLPDATFDASWGSIPSNVRTAVKNAVEALGFTFAVQTTWTVRRVLNYVANQIQPEIDVSAGDVQDM